MLWLLALRKERVAPLADYGAEGMRRIGDGWRTLPCRDATCVHEGRVEVTIMTRAREDVGRDLCSVSHHQC